MAPAPPKQRTAIWKLTWGAIVLDNATGYATSTDQRSRRAAERKAMKKCRSIGGKACKIVMYYENQCASIADPVADLEMMTSISHSGLSIEEANDGALQMCAEANGGHACKIIYSNCTKPYLVYD